MDNAPLPTGPALRERRELTIKVLVDQFAQDRLTLEEFEQRLDRAHKAVQIEQLDRLVADLAVPATAAPRAVAPAPAQASPTEVRDHQTLVAIMGGVERRGRWTPARKINLIAVMGGADLDFREAQFAPGVTELDLVCIMGGCDIVVPPGLVIDADGSALMGGFSHLEHRPRVVSPEAPVLRIRGFAFMGGVDIQVRAPGESRKDARLRERDERRRLREEQRRIRGE